MTETVIQYVLRRLDEIGVGAIFGVPGDFAFSTTYGVGELSAINAIAGSYAENLPLFHLTGMPTMPVQATHALVHHTLGNGEFDRFKNMAEWVVCGSAIMTPQTVAFETERLIAAALYHRRPVYMAFPSDLANRPVAGRAQPHEPPFSNPDSLARAVDAIHRSVDNAATACVLPGLLAARLRLRDDVQRFVDASGLPFATMFADKSILDEQQPGYIGMYDGRLMDEDVRAFVESCDHVVCIGTMMTDFNSGAFTARLEPTRTTTIGHHHCKVGNDVYTDVEMRDVLIELTSRVAKRSRHQPLRRESPGEPVGAGNDPISAEALYPRWERFFQPGDIIIAETGTVSMGLGFAHLPRGAEFHNQTLWGSIGWATPASFGAAVAQPKSRILLITGEGSHQLTAQEISQFARRGLRPIIFVLNNNGYLIERLLCKDPDISYNDIAHWNYTDLPHALGAEDWYTARTTTCGELDQAMAMATEVETAAYIEVVTDTYAASRLALKLGDNQASLYNA
ncbi:hypothetical protein KO481_22340 [Nocardia sp. NEAU-G5]|uniref:Alpha-keto-acid decarboxylase n=1 Tax=Nocardia albiluteola TaxID=2842303 RepID=A0ABS6B3B0_9NOCA|nr:thiamine pyrophosphate-dependent enzyme [Nocardia albiluteola]MBU3064260.1 hypothetical protein [Nocardia albiluteola]